jgi:hypothetical protein
MKVGRQFIAWDVSKKASVPQGRCEPRCPLIQRQGRRTSCRPDHTVPYGTELLCGPFPGNELPGYDHSVPSGRVEQPFGRD